ncbi:hypothetical protein SLEP1_g28084 [Rubroshorea leprosula]|uniref:Pectinesterase inhibitor domain-containing protein n=1 Tax=Rubroshorea leprosula TaxID=152421 RepID=A0AAV5JSH9_9ROSI|nr:hypothetical protein SLEP1_g28084 [Rubroshorea leprosula]
MEAKSLSIFSISCLSILLLLLMITNMEPVSSTATATTKASSTSYITYVQTACSSTTYPEDCYNSLSSYASTIKANPQKLCKAALTVTLKATKNASAVIKSLSKMKGLPPGDSAVIKDCADNVKDSVDRLKQSLKALKNLRGYDREFQLANMKTWASAALTDHITCADAINDGNVSSSVNRKINTRIRYLERLTSNLLAILNSLNH